MASDALAGSGGSATGGRLPCDRFAQVYAENLISAFGEAILADVLPLFFVSFLLAFVHGVRVAK